MKEVKEINYGPLKALIGIWQGDKGMDIAPESDGTEENPFYETITITKSGDITNGEQQVLAILHYRRIVARKSDDGSTATIRRNALEHLVRPQTHC